jgi:hypothetical protein
MSTITLSGLQNRHRNTLWTLRLSSVVSEKSKHRSDAQPASQVWTLEIFEFSSMGDEKLVVGTTIANSCKSIRGFRLSQEDTQCFDSVVLEVDDNLRVENVDLKDIFLAAKEDIGSSSPVASVAKPFYLDFETLELVACEAIFCYVNRIWYGGAIFNLCLWRIVQMPAPHSRDWLRYFGVWNRMSESQPCKNSTLARSLSLESYVDLCGLC